LAFSVVLGGSEEGTKIKRKERRDGKEGKIVKKSRWRRRYRFNVVLSESFKSLLLCVLLLLFSWMKFHLFFRIRVTDDGKKHIHQRKEEKENKQEEILEQVNGKS
jgi:hypothetical protein